MIGRLNIIFTTKGNHLFPFLYLLYMLSISCNSDTSKIPNLDNDQDYSKGKAKQVTIIISQNALTKAEITAPVFVSNDKARPPYLEMPKGVNATFYDEDLKPESTLTAKYARYYDNSKNILVKDSVVVINADSNKLYTEELVWNNQLEKFYTDKQVVIYGKDQVIYGDGLEANKDFTIFKIIRQRGVIPMQKVRFLRNNSIKLKDYIFCHAVVGVISNIHIPASNCTKIQNF